MSGYVDKAVSALIARLQFGKFVTRDGSKIADITHADTNEHTLTPSALGLPANVVAIKVDLARIAGTGNIRILTTSLGQSFSVSTGFDTVWPISDTGVFLYSLSVANDDWDVFCFGYWTEGSVIE